MLENDKAAISKLRLDNALRCIKSAKILLEEDDFKSAANRSYYAVFYAIRAVLAMDSIDFKKHSAVIAHFRKEYIKTGLFDTSYSLILSELFEVRTDSDYDDFYILSKEDVIRQINNAEHFVKTVIFFLSEKIDLSEINKIKS